jgi:hypothetical protein
LYGVRLRVSLLMITPNWSGCVNVALNLKWSVMCSLDEYGGAGQFGLFRRERRGTALMSCHMMACLSWSPSSLPGRVIGTRDQPH